MLTVPLTVVFPVTGTGWAGVLTTVTVGVPTMLTVPLTVVFPVTGTGWAGVFTTTTSLSGGAATPSMGLLHAKTAIRRVAPSMIGLEPLNLFIESSFPQT